MKLLHYPALPALLFALSLAAEAQSSSRYAALVDVEGLGAISFPNSGAPEAQEACFRGVLLLHSFEFSPAAEAFRKAQEYDADFALAYWGEAMTYNHPLWRQFDGKSGQTALQRYPSVTNA